MSRVATASKYRPFPPVDLPDRSWPDRVLIAPPLWCSVDLRDGNQALVNPMGADRKDRLFDELVAIGFREIEVGYPSASQTEFDFVRELIEQDRIPDDVTIQVLTPCIEDRIRRTFEAIRGARRVVVHLYNSTSTLQRRVVFRHSREQTVALAVAAARLCREQWESMRNTEVVPQYSPESFTGTELDFAVEICDAVLDVWEPSREAPAIVNLPSTVEMATPNVYADQIEWFGREVGRRDALVLSVHPHNDRGTAVAAAELAMMAGAERVEGTLFGNGERTGNVDLVTLAMNLWSQGVDPGLDFSDLPRVVRTAEHCTRLPVHDRHPYAGELVFSAFSGTHQDAINKGLAARREGRDPHWAVPYLPVDPQDVGRSYDAVIRINSQSGKGGIAYVLEQDFGYRLPRGLQVEFGRKVQEIADREGEELAPRMLCEAFEEEYLRAFKPYTLMEVLESSRPGEACELTAMLSHDGLPVQVAGRGNGPLAAFVAALRNDLEIDVQVGDYQEHALGSGADAVAIAYVEVVDPDGSTHFGVGRDASLVRASLQAVICAVNRCVR